MTKLIDIKEVCVRTSLSRAMINRYRAANDFPPAVVLGERRIAFVATEVDDWIDARIKARVATAAAGR